MKDINIFKDRFFDSLFKAYLQMVTIAFAVILTEFTGITVIMQVPLYKAFRVFLEFTFTISYLSLWTAFYGILLIAFSGHKKLILLIYKVLTIIIFIFYFIVIIYYFVTGVPMDAAIFAHSFSEIKTTVSSSINNLYLWIVILTAGIAAIVYLSHISVKRIDFNTITYKIIFLIMAALAVMVFIPKPSIKSDNNIAVNKFEIFLKSVFDYAGAEQRYTCNTIDKQTLENFRNNLNTGNFIGNEYPALHLAGDENPLGAFFGKGKNPNIVFIACESLSADFFGNNSYFGNFTPFLDSLSKHGLCWHNCLSSTERTFGVLPALTGSLPFGKKGFAALEGNYPNHLTLMSLLKTNGYRTSYFHGGPLGFDNLYDFIKYQQPDYIFNEPGNGHIADDVTNKEVSWGLTDDVLFDTALTIIARRPHDKPQFDLFLTLTTHAPYNIPNRKYWESIFDKQIKKLSPQQKKRALKYKYRLSAFLYLDDVLRKFIYGYLKVTQTTNTIFVITGDHRLGIKARNQLIKYNVPLIIYSPELIEKPRNFDAVVNHMTIPPSMTALLQQNFNLNFPDTVCWMSGVIDTNRSFRNIYSFPFMRNSRVVKEYIYKRYFLYGNRVYTFNRHFDVKPADNDSVRKLLQRNLDDYMRINYYMCLNNKLLPYRILPDIYGFKEIPAKNSFKTLTIEKNMEYQSLIPATTLTEVTDKYRIIIDFDVIKSTVADSFPRIIMTLTESEKNIIWKNMKPENYTGHISIQYSFIPARFGAEEKPEFLLYFWNLKKSQVEIKNLKVKLERYSKER